MIEVKNLGKRYNISHQKGGYIALRDVIAGAFKSPFRFLKNKAIGTSSNKKTREDFWALKDVNFNVQKGEVVGIIGSNGAGKSTLLKILSQITPPTTGEIRINGRVGSLLEVGTGFHPELSGRENIMLNGAILGMTYKEVARKFDQIVEFSGVEKFLDTPVKYYSSGMYVRLAFSVAAHMEPDILIVDEVLAVGDAEFQKKCLGKMDEITKEEGRTILFVSHNMSAIRQLCKKTILMKNGQVNMFGETSEVIEKYMDEAQNRENVKLVNKVKNDNGFNIESIAIKGKTESDSNVVLTGQPASIEIDYSMTHSESEPVEVNLVIESLEGRRVATLNNMYVNSPFTPNTSKGKIICNLPSVNLNIGLYTVVAYISIKKNPIYWAREMMTFSVIDGDYFKNGHNPDAHDGSLLIEQEWSFK